jgi:mannitol/fructose-specific phosphotransferase system IIA component (Ntr-type)
MGDGVAILHGRVADINEPAVALGILPQDHGVDFGAGDEAEIDIIYMVLSPLDKPEQHLQVLAAIAGFLSNADLRTRLRNAGNENEAMAIIREYQDREGNHERSQGDA